MPRFLPYVGARRQRRDSGTSGDAYTSGISVRLQLPSGTLPTAMPRGRWLPTYADDGNQATATTRASRYYLT